MLGACALFGRLSCSPRLSESACVELSNVFALRIGVPILSENNMLFKRSAQSAGPASETPNPNVGLRLQAVGLQGLADIVNSVMPLLGAGPESRCSVGSAGYAKKPSAYLSSDGKTECSGCVCRCVCVCVQ